jgi:hypothetical protein
MAHVRLFVEQQDLEPRRWRPDEPTKNRPEQRDERGAVWGEHQVGKAALSFAGEALQL